MHVKKPIPSLVFIAVGAAALCVSLLLAETLIVKVQSTSLRSGPKFYAPVVQALKAGEKLEKVSGQPDGWLKVRTAGGAVGWIHTSAVRVQKFDLLAMDKGLKTQASASEVALAGKGFNKQVEESYRAKHAEVSFAWVDKMLLIKIPADRVEEFIKKGKLGEWRGAQ
jgi:uncharacterized protein YraI